jgi:hypothetical protein
VWLRLDRSGSRNSVVDKSYKEDDLEEGVPRPRQRVGLHFRVPHNLEVTFDGARHFALGYGDDNPLWCDRRYAGAPAGRDR